VKDRKGPDCVFKIVSLIRKIYVRTVKTKVTVSKDTAAVEEVVDLGDNKGVRETEAGVLGKGRKKMLDGSAVGVVDVPEGNVEGWFGEAGVGTGGERGNAEEACLVVVGGDDSAGVVGVSLELKNRRKGRGVLKNLGDSEKF
jgi:hypothetical protein